MQIITRYTFSAFGWTEMSQKPVRKIAPRTWVSAVMNRLQIHQEQSIWLFKDVEKIYAATDSFICNTKMQYMGNTCLRVGGLSRYGKSLIFGRRLRSPHN